MLKLTLTFDDGTKDHYNYAKPLLEKYGFHAIFNIASGVINDGKWQGAVAMTWDDIRALVSQGHEIGIHSVTHANMKHLAQIHDMVSFVKEVKDSRLEIEQKTGFTPKFFCYPYNQRNLLTDVLLHRMNLEAMQSNERPLMPDSLCEGGIRSMLGDMYRRRIRVVDLQFHGICPGGGWHPFNTVDEFEKLLKCLYEEQKAGRVKVCKYSEVHKCYQGGLIGLAADIFWGLVFALVYSPVRELNVIINTFRGVYTKG